jgi:thiol-disulfide isomerase/thioredoxin/protocatechuate 3,4-dioxygenase beta subunit
MFFAFAPSGFALAQAAGDVTAGRGEQEAEQREKGTGKEAAKDDVDNDKGKKPVKNPDENEAGAEGKKEKSDPKPVHVLVEGQVVDAMGTGDNAVMVVARRIGEDGKPGEVFVQTTTSEYGDFQVTYSERWKGELEVKFSKLGFSSETRRVVVGGSEWPEFLDVQLKGTLVLNGVISDALSKTGIAGAAVELSVWYDEYSAVSDDKGAFSFSQLSPGQGQLVVSANGYGRESRRIEVGGGEDQLDIALKPDRTVRFHVTDGSGSAVAEAVLEVVDEARNDFRSVITDAGGRAELKGLHFDAERLQVRTSHPEFVSSNEFGTEIDMPADSRESFHEIVMRRAGRITGRVVSGGLAEVVSGARVMTGCMYSDDSPRAWSDYRGNFEILGVPPGPVVLTVHAGGFAPHLVRLDIEASAVEEIDIKLGGGVTFTGTVLDDEGKPVSGATVAAMKWRDCSTLGLRAMTGLDGKFAIPDMPEDEVQMMVTGPGGSHLAEVIRAKSIPHEFKLPKAPEGASGGGSLASVKVGDEAPAFDASTVDGKPLVLSKLQGKTVLLDFWATWCGPCVAEIPNLVKVHEEFGSRKDFEIISVSLDFDEAAMKKFVKKRKMDWIHVFGDDAKSIADGYGVKGIPALFLIGPDGKVTATDLYGESVIKTVEASLQGS